MTKIFENLLEDLFKDAFGIIDIVFGKLIKMVFFVEDGLSDGSIFQNAASSSSNSLFFESIFSITVGIGITLCSVKLAKKLFDTYILDMDGDSSNPPERVILGYIKALIIIFSFNYLYKAFADISLEFTNSILSAIGVSTIPSLSTILRPYIGNGLFVLIGLLVFLIGYLMLIFQFIKRGLEMFILRLGIPLAVTGLIDSDNGVFAPYIKLFIQNSITVVIQLGLLLLGLGVLSNGNIFFGIGAVFMALKTPAFLNQFMVSVGSANINLNQIYSGARMFAGVKKFIRKG